MNLETRGKRTRRTYAASINSMIGRCATRSENLKEMLGVGLWGVPSFRISGGNDMPFACWGQDRIWRVESEIAHRAKKDN